MRRKCTKNPPIFILKIGNCCEIRLFLDLLYKTVKEENLVRKSPRRFNTLKSNEVARSELNREKIGNRRGENRGNEGTTTPSGNIGRK